MLYVDFAYVGDLVMRKLDLITALVSFEVLVYLVAVFSKVVKFVRREALECSFGAELHSQLLVERG
jgi:hypothetical protein